VKKLVSLLTLGCVLLAAIGYIVASTYRTTIEQAERQQAIASGKTGIDFGGRRVPATQFKVGSRVKWPFVVVGYYAVPFDLHATIYSTKYLVMPWGIYTLSHKSEYPL